MREVGRESTVWGGIWSKAKTSQGLGGQVGWGMDGQEAARELSHLDSRQVSEEAPARKGKNLEFFFFWGRVPPPPPLSSGLAASTALWVLPTFHSCYKCLIFPFSSWPMSFITF